MPSPMTTSVQPLASLNGAVALTTGVAPGPLCHRLFVNATTASTVTITMADGSTASLGALPVGVYQFDVEFTSVTFTAGTAVGFYRVEG